MPYNGYKTEGVKKHDRRIFELALDTFELNAEQCLYIGDHPLHDIEGPFTVGMETIWLRVNCPWREGLTARPRHVIDRLDELLHLL